MKKTFTTLCFTFVVLGIYAQNVGINTTGAAPNASAMLDIESTTKGLLIPRVALTSTVSNAPIGGGVTTSLMVYNTATAADVTPGYYYWSGTAWLRILTSANAWQTLGNTGTVSGTNYLGTTDAQALDFRTNNSIRFRIANGDQVYAMTAGTAAVPFYSWNGDPNTGMSNLAADQLNWSTNGVERLRLTNTQLGTTFLGTAAVPAYSFTTDVNTGIFSPAADVVAMAANGAERIRSTNTEVVVNENANAVNFRVEGATNANLLVTSSASTAVGFQRVPMAQSVGGAVVVNDMSYPFEIGSDGGGALQATIGWYNGSDVIIVPETDWWGYVGNATRAWYEMNSYGYINVSSKSKKRNITPIFGDKSMESYVMNSIDNLQTYFYKYNHEEDVLNPDNYTKYRPMMHIGTILEETPDFLKSPSFSGVDIYAIATLGVAGVKINSQEIKELKAESRTISDFGSVSPTSSSVNVSFDAEFIQKSENQIPVITLSSNNTDIKVSIISKNSNGFTIKIDGTIPANLNIDWIAMTKKTVRETDAVPDIDATIKNQLEVPSHIKKQMIELYNQTPTVKPSNQK